jgi:hypothetical protein
MFLYFSLTLLIGLSYAYYTKEDSISTEVVQSEISGTKSVSSSAPKKVTKADSSKVNQIRRFFSKGMDRFSFVDTVTYTSRVPWLKGRPAWIADYASHYETSRHYIARGLNGKEDYVSQNVSPGDTFNVLNPEKDIEFHLLVDLSTCTLDFTCTNNETGHTEFIKSYSVGVGRKDSFSPSGSLTPLGKYKLGEKIAIYKRGVENYFQKKKTHMIEVFGTRWIPFGEEIENCTDSAKGYGLHGLPFVLNEADDVYTEDLTCLGDYSSDGCIRLAEKDINEIFSIVITKPTFIQIVKEKDATIGSGE